MSYSDRAYLLKCVDEMHASLKEMTPDMPPADAMCHYGIVPQSECSNCQRIARAHAILAKFTELKSWV